ncbi:MAG TPA: MotA/TolQ/ExbB proton channel family protein [Planctomycetaceae bacterium]|nr:MotA/TolQ/ExbB proton channel family protein [Planctomycetaceae bacterium]
MDFPAILDAVGIGIYILQAVIALYGVFLVVLLFRRIQLQQFASPARAAEFLAQVRESLQQRRFDQITELCDSPPYWTKVVPQLILVALANRERELSKIRRLLAEKFERDVLADFEYRMSWISTIIKSAPMLGLLGTVQGMIGAFGKIAAVSKETGTDPSQLAGDISFALWTTAIGLLTAIPLVLAAAAIHVRIGKLQDGVQQGVGEFLDDFEEATRNRRPA